MSLQERINAQKAAAEIKAAQIVLEEQAAQVVLEEQAAQAESAELSKKLEIELTELNAELEVLVNGQNVFGELKNAEVEVTDKLGTLKSSREVLRDIHKQSVDIEGIAPLPKPYEMITDAEYKEEQEIKDYDTSRSILAESVARREVARAQLESFGLEGSEDQRRYQLQELYLAKKKEIQQFVIDNPDLKTELAEQIREKLIQESTNKILLEAKKENIHLQAFGEKMNSIMLEPTRTTTVTEEYLAKIKERKERGAEHDVREIERIKRDILKTILKEFTTDTSFDVLINSIIVNNVESGEIDTTAITQSVKQIVCNYIEKDGEIKVLTYKRSRDYEEKLFRLYEAISGNSLEEFKYADESGYTAGANKAISALFDSIPTEFTKKVIELAELKKIEAGWDSNERAAKSEYSIASSALQQKSEERHRPLLSTKSETERLERDRVLKFNSLTIGIAFRQATIDSAMTHLQKIDFLQRDSLNKSKEIESAQTSLNNLEAELAELETASKKPQGIMQLFSKKTNTQEKVQEVRNQITELTNLIQRFSLDLERNKSDRVREITSINNNAQLKIIIDSNLIKHDFTPETRGIIENKIDTNINHLRADISSIEDKLSVIATSVTESQRVYAEYENRLTKAQDSLSEFSQENKAKLIREISDKKSTLI